MLYVLPFISGLIGWVTNYIAVKMLFHPRMPIKLGFVTLHGVFPKRQKVLAEKLGKIVGQELFSIDDIAKSLNSEATNAEIVKILESKIDDFINVRLTETMPMLSMFLNDDLKLKIKITLLNEVEGMIPDLLEGLVKKVKSEIDIEKIVHDKVVNFSVEKLEEILVSVMKKEFKTIEVLGGVLGFIIGIIQAVIVSVYYSGTN